MQRVFRWVSGAKRALRLDELEEAVGLDLSDECLPTNRIARGAGERLVSDCGNLVMHDAGDNTVGFAHHTVLQYLCEASKDQQTALLPTDFNAVSVNEYIGDICLAYLCFSDFETQLVKVPKQMDIQREAAEELLWWGVPFAPRLRRAIDWARSSSSKAPLTSNRRIPLALPAYTKPSSPWTRKFSLLEYIISYWAFHTANITRSSSSWSRFRDVALERQLLFEFRPWREPQHRAKVESVLADIQVHTVLESSNDALPLASNEHMLMYAWAMTEGARSFLTLINPTDIGPYPALVSTEAAIMRDTVYFDTFYYLVKEESFPPRVLHHGFWNGKLLYLAARGTWYGNSNHKHVLDLCFDEYNRWTDTDALSFEVFYQDAILCAVQEVDITGYQRLINYHVHDFQQLMSTLACLILANQAKAFAIKGLLSLNFSHAANDSSPHLQLELLFALAQCMPTIQMIAEADADAFSNFNADAFSKVNEHLRATMAVATLISGQRTAIRTVLNVLDGSFGTIIYQTGSDWKSTVFGTKKAYDRLVQLQLKGGSHLRDGYGAYVQLLRDMTSGHACAADCYRNCKCQLDIAEILFQHELGICDDAEDDETALLSAYKDFAGCHLDRNPSSKLLRWSIKSSDALWERVIALPLPQYAIRHAYNATLLGLEKDGEDWYLVPKDERYQKRLAQLKARTRNN